MKAIRVYEFGGPEKLKLEEMNDLKPGAGQVVVRIHALNHSSDRKSTRLNSSH